MTHIKCIVLYVITLLCISEAMPYRSNETNLLSHHDTNSVYMKELLRQAKAAEMSSFLNTSVDPCDDFYEFACGNWQRINRATPEIVTTGQFERLTDGLNRKLKIVLNRVDQDKEPAIDKLVKNYYKSCMKLKEIDKSLRHTKYKSIIEEFGGMPVLQGANWSEANFDWVETVSKIAFNYGITILTGVKVSKDFANNKMNAVYIGEQSFALETRRAYLSNDTALYRQGFEEGLASSIELNLGVEKSLAMKTAKELKDFEVELAQGLLNETDDPSQADINTLMTLEEMQQLYAPDIDVERLVKGSLGVRVEKVYNYNPQFHENLIKVLQRTSKRVVANYIFYRLVDEFLFGTRKTKAEKEEHCTAETKRHFARILDNLVFRSYNNNATSNDIKTIWSELKTVFREQLLTDTSLNWINNQTRNSAVTKLDAMTLQINSYDLEELTAEYSKLNLTDDDFYLNQRRIKRHVAFKNRDQLNKPVKPLYDGVQLSYSPVSILEENAIKIPVAFLQPYYMLEASYPSAIKFGTLASLIGHELIHGFDNNGQDYDADGNVKSWCDEQSMANFVERQNCFKQQYSKYFYYGKELPESNDQAENIADNGGLRLAYAAYRRWLYAQLLSGKAIQKLENERLPSLDYSIMQLFFISYAQVWCNDIKDDTRNMLLAMDKHTPGKFRVIGTLSNSEEFAEVFKCNQGERMNPVKKCTIY